MQLTELSPALLTGQDAGPMQLVEHNQQLHQAVIPAYRQMQQAAAQQGIAIRLVSGWRSFERQAAIWQAKCEGRRPVFDRWQRLLKIEHYQGLAKLEAIMLYSALPGASRHHWGSDLDIYDAAAVSNDYQVQLQQSEYSAGGPFYRLSQWLTQHAAQYGFFLPYREFQGGVAAEPWHLSYQPLATRCQQALTLEQLRLVLQQHPIAEQQTVLAHLPELYRRFICNICEALP